ncbi:MAG TPA: hypothetical protein VGD22_16810 [Sphingobacteriaceae bacterium]
MADLAYLIGGMLAICSGIYITIGEVRRWMAGERDKYGNDIKSFFSGIVALMLGLFLLV